LLGTVEGEEAIEKQQKGLFHPKGGHDE